MKYRVGVVLLLSRAAFVFTRQFACLLDNYKTQVTRVHSMSVIILAYIV